MDNPPCGDSFVGCATNISPAFDAKRFEREFCDKAGIAVSCCVIDRRLAVAIAMSRTGQFVLSAACRRITAVFGELHRSSLALLAVVPDITAHLARGLEGSGAMLRFENKGAVREASGRPRLFCFDRGVVATGSH